MKRSERGGGATRQLDGWLPRWSTPRLHDVSDGPEVVDFAASVLRVTKGFEAGNPLIFRPWQAWLLDALYERRADGRRRYRRCLVGVGRKNGKSLIGSTIALHGLFEGPVGAEVYACAGDRQQARIVFDECANQIRHSPSLASRAKTYRHAIEDRERGGVFRVLSAEAGLQQGLNPSLVVFDEVHVQRTHELWDAMTLGSGARLDPLVVGITTAGHDVSTLCGELFQYGQRIAKGELEDDAFGMWWWSARDDCDVDDEHAWAEANPNLAEGLLDVEDLRTSARQTHANAFRRFRLNQWTRADESWLPPGAWDACEGESEADPERPMWVGVDMALKHDSIAIVWAQPNGERIDVDAHVIFPSGTTVDIAMVENHLRDLHRRFNVQEVAYDPAYFERSAQALIDEGLPMLEFPQSAQRMVPACQNAYALICSGRLRHHASTVFTDQVLSAAQRQTDAGWRLSKARSSRKIDAAIALVIALDRATRRTDEPAESVYLERGAIVLG